MDIAIDEVIDEVSDGLQTELDAMWRFALKLTKSEDDAADLVLRTCVRALEQRSSYNSSGKLRSWLFRIEHRIWLNELRSRQVRQQGSFSTFGGSDIREEQQAGLSIGNIRVDQPEGNVLFQQLVDVVQSLPEAQRLVMLLVHVEGCSYKETADILDAPIGTIMSRLSRARLSVGEQMLNQGINADA